MIAALVIFVFAYALISGIHVPGVKLDRTSAAIVGAVAMVVAGALPLGAALGAINLDTITLLFGMMVVTAYLVEARFFEWLAWLTITHARTPRRLLVALVFVGGLLAAVFVNDTICVMFTPLVVLIIDAAELPALPYLLALSTSTNIGGVATYTGNPQNMIIGTHAGISFGNYFLHLVPVALLGLVANAALLLLLFRRQLDAHTLRPPAHEAPTIDRPLALKSLAVLVVTMVCFFAGYSLAGTALFAAALLIVIANRPPRKMLERVDYALLVFFSGLFVIVEGVAHTGILAGANAWIMPRLGHTPAVQLTNFALVTVVGSNLFSNVPFVLLGLDAAPRLLDPARGWMVLAMASTLAGNLTIFGSVANLIVLELAGRHGKVGFFRFLKYGVVITAVTTAIGLAVLIGEASMGF